MLQRSFKSTKCKTSLKLAASRIKLLKNKRETQVKQMKRELAQLLESGQDQTARIRAEHVVREEKTMAAYDLLEIYCELIVARLPIIESQKNCPIDLKEAISSVIFASPRCADVPELMDVRKHFTVKYGKDFVSAAVELSPDCGVSRLLVEELSVKAPDGPTKIKILSAIAEEHNIKWDPKSFGEKESKPSEDLLNGPSTFGNASQMFVNPSYVQASPGRDDKGPSNFQVPPKSNEKHDVPVNFQEQNARSSPSYQTDTGTNKANYSAAFHPESMPSGSGTERMGSTHSYAGDEKAHSTSRHDWNTEFKDATAAARAAAESAERASMAARAAADLSSRGNITLRHLAESQRDEEPHKYPDSTLQSEHHAKGPVNIALHGRNYRMDSEQMNGNQQDDVIGIAENVHEYSFKSTDQSSRSASLKSSAASVDGDPLVNNLLMADRYSRKNSSELGQGDHLGQVSFKKQSSRSEVDYVNKLQGGLNPETVGGFEEARVRKQTSHASSPSHSRTFTDDDDVVSNFNSHSLGGDVDENPFAVYNMGTIRRNPNKSSSPENAAAVFDDYGLDRDECKVDLEAKHKEHEYIDFSSHGRKSPTHMFGNTNAWHERQNIDESTDFSKEGHSDPVFSESLPSSTVPSHPDDVLPANFDDSDASISECEEELDKSELVMSKDTNRSNVYPRTSEVIHGESYWFIDDSFVDKGNEESSKPWSRSSSFNSNPVEVNSDRHQGTRVNAGSARKFGYGDVTTSQSPPRFTASKLNFDDPHKYNQLVDEEKHEQSQQSSRFSMGHEVRDNVLAPPPDEAMEDTETLKESCLESVKELNFSILTGGLRNKGYKRPPYITSQSLNASSSKQTAEDTSTKSEESLSATVKVSNSSGATNQDPYTREVRTESDGKPSSRAHFGSHDDNSYDELPQQTSTSSQDRYIKKAGIEENKRSSSRTQFKYLDSTNSDSEDDFPREALNSEPRLNPGFSRRKKVSPSKSEKSSYPKPSVWSEASVSSGFGEEMSSPSRISYRTESVQKPQSENNSSGCLGSSENPRLAEEPANKPIQEPKRSFFVENLKPAAKEQASNPLPTIVTSGSAESLKTSSGESPTKEKASHVHPKLPDYDAITAHLRSLRKNHQ